LTVDVPAANEESFRVVACVVRIAKVLKNVEDDCSDRRDLLAAVEAEPVRERRAQDGVGRERVDGGS
jgi:hypothetical protein